MLNLMEDDINRQVSEEQKYQAEASEKPVESIYRPRAFLFERQPTRYAWFAIDSSNDLKERGGTWKRMNKCNNISQNVYCTQRSGNVPGQSFKRPCNTNALPRNKFTEYYADKSETNITCTKQGTRKRNIQKTNETPIRYGNKRKYFKEENIATKVNLRQENKCEDKNEITKDEVSSYQVAKTPAEEGLKFKDDMEHRKNPPFAEAQNYLEHSDITNTITAGQHSEAHVFGAKSSDTSDKLTETKYDSGKQDTLKLSASPEPADINNHFMTATDTDKSGKTSSLQSQCLEANKLNDKNLICNDAKENRIFGRTSDNLSTLNTEAVKFSFGTNITDTPYKEAIVFSAKDRQKNQNEADVLKQTTLKLRKPDEITRRNTSGINECNDSAQAVVENALSNDYLSLEEKYDDQIKQNSGKEIFSQSMKPSRREKYGFQRQNDLTVRPMVEKEQTNDSDNQKISNEKDMATLSLIPDANAESAETICKTCLALQEAEKSNYKSFSVVIDTLTEVNQKSPKGYTWTEVNQKPSKGDTLIEVNKKPSKEDTLRDVHKKPSKGKFICDGKQDETKTESEKFTDETVCEKTEPYDFSNTQHKINNISEIERQGSSVQKDLYTTKPEQSLTDDPIDSSSADKSAGEVHSDSSTIPNTQDLVKAKYSVSSENSQAVENDSQPSAESLVTDQQTKAKKHKRGWFIRLFSRLHKRKLKKGVECDVGSAPSESCS